MALQLTPEEVEKRIKTLTRNEWIVVRFHCLGYSNVEIGQLMKRQPGGIGTWLFRACQKLGIKYNSDVERDAALNSFWAEELRKREPKALVPIIDSTRTNNEDDPPIPSESKEWILVILERNLARPRSGQQLMITGNSDSPDIIDVDPPKVIRRTVVG